MLKSNFELYEWFAQYECFTFAEMQMVSELVPPEVQNKVIVMIWKNCHATLIDYLNTADIVDVDYSIYPIVNKPATRTKQIYNFIQDETFSLPETIIE